MYTPANGSHQEPVSTARGWKFGDFHRRAREIVLQALQDGRPEITHVLAESHQISPHNVIFRSFDSLPAQEISLEAENRQILFSRIEPRSAAGVLRIVEQAVTVIIHEISTFRCNDDLCASVGQGVREADEASDGEEIRHPDQVQGVVPLIGCTWSIAGYID